MNTVASVLEVCLYGLIVLVVLRSIMSWFPALQGNDMGRFIVRATEPLLAPFRRIIPSMGMFDLSGLVVVVLLTIMVTAVRRTADL
ncbi:MAG: YggT family protein [Dehalococcoidia bacterium]